MGLGFGSGSSGEKDSSSSSSMNEDRTTCNRHTTYQTQLLEAFYRDNPQPSDEQRRELSREIGLDVKQIKFWYQNKKALTKAQGDRADNNVLRAENEKMSYENEALKEALSSIICFDCGGAAFGDNSDVQQLLNENANLKQEFGNIAKVIAKYTGKLPLLQVDSVVKKTGAPSSCFMHNQQVPYPMMMNNPYFNNADQDAAGLGSTIPPPPPPSLPPMMMNYNAALNQPQGILNSSTLAPPPPPPPPPPMMMNNAGFNNQPNFGIPLPPPPPPPSPPMMMNNAGFNHQANFGIPPPPPMMMNNYDTAAFNHQQQQGIFGIPTESTPAPAAAPDGLLMPDNNNLLEPGMAADEEGPTTLAELMKLLG